MKDQIYWFYTFPQVYVHMLTLQEMVLYNTQNGTILKSNEYTFNQWIERIYKPENLGVISLSEDCLSTCSKDLLDEAIEKGMINIEEISDPELKPINFLPLLSLQKDFDKFKNNESLEQLGDNMISYLSQLNIYLNARHDIPSEWNYINRQLLFPLSSCLYGDNQLNFDAISTVLSDSCNSMMKTINILGNPNVYYNEQEKLSYMREQFPHFKYHLWYIALDMDYAIKNTIPNFVYDFVFIPSLMGCPEEFELKAKKFPYLNDMDIHIYVTNSDEYNKCSALFHRYNITLSPLYNSSNLQFFKENVFLSEEDILSAPISMRRIFSNQKVNSTFFGTFNIYPDGTVKAHPNATKLGNIYTDNIKNIIFRELVKNTAWRKIRDNEKCNSCCYRFLCPSPSLYEDVIDNPALCNI